MRAKRGAEALEVFGSAGQRDLVRAAGRGLRAELAVGHVHRLAGEVAVGGELAADDGDEALHRLAAVTASGGVVVDDVAAGDGARRALGLIRQRPHAGVGEEHVLAGESRFGDDEVGLVEEVLDLPLLGLDVVEVAVVAEVGGANEVAPVPRDDEVRSAVGAGLDVERLPRRARKRVHDYVGAFRTPDHALGAPP